MSEVFASLVDSSGRVWMFISTIIGGGIGLKIVESFLNRGASSRSIRTDWLAEVAAQNARIDTLEAEIESWRTKYYDQQVTIAKLQVQIVQLGGRVD